MSVVAYSERINNMLEEANFVENNASQMKLGSCDEYWYTENNDTNCTYVRYF